MKNLSARMLAVALALTGFFLFSLSAAKSTNPPVVITEIGAYEKEGVEWVEIYNRSTLVANLQGWKFYEDETNHKLSVAQGDDFVLEPGEYALIVDNADSFLETYPLADVSVFDSSWGTLKEAGEEIGLKDNEGSFVETFTYIGAPDFSLERKDSELMEYSSANWQQHPSSNSVGKQNHWSVQVDDGSDVPDNNTPAAQEQTRSSAGSSIAISYKKSTVLITEIVSDPAEDENEFIEIYNTTDFSVELQGWVIQDGSHNETQLSGILLPLSYHVIENPEGKLNNNGDRLLLKDGYNNQIDELTYGNWDDGNVENNAPSARDPFSLIRFPVDTDVDDDSSEFVITSTVTKGVRNVLSSHTEIEEAPPLEDAVVIHEIFPNPKGSDRYTEYIELKNEGGNDVNVTGWELADGISKYSLDGSIASQGYMVISREVSGIVLNNAGKEELVLRDNSGVVVSKLTYSGPVEEGESFARNEDGEYMWTQKPTRGLENEIQVENRPPVVLISSRVTGRPGTAIAFDASDTIDPDNDALNFVWDFGDESQGEGDYVMHVYDREGVYTTVLTVSDTSGHHVTSQAVVRISSTDLQESVGVGGNLLSYIEISELVANPFGSDATEYIELYNSSPEIIDLSGLKLDDSEGGSRAYTIPQGTYIDSGAYYVFGRQDTKLALNNTTDSVRLLDDDGAVISEVAYDDVKEGASYVKDENGAWVWSSQTTPAQQNVITPILPKQATSPRVVRRSKTQKKVIETTLENIRNEDIGDRVIVKGVVAVMPGVFSDQYMYIAGSPGVQVYMHSKDFPKLHVGDRVEVTGEISEAYGETRIKVKKKSDIVYVDHPGDPRAEQIDIAQIGEPFEGNLVSVSAEVTDIKSSYMWIDDGTEEVKVYLKRGAGIDKGEMFEGAVVSVTGIVQQTRNGYQLLPRSNTDLVYTGQIKEPTYVKMQKAKESDRELAEKYLTATAGGLTSIVLGLLGKVHGSGALRVLKKIVLFIARRRV